MKNNRLELIIDNEGDQEFEALESEISQLYLFEQLSYAQKVKFLKGRDINEVFDNQFKSLNRVRKKIISGG